MRIEVHTICVSHLSQQLFRVKCRADGHVASRQRVFSLVVLLKTNANGPAHADGDKNSSI